MKKAIYYIFILSYILLLTGCANDLNITPDGRISMNDVWSDQKRSEAYLNSCYQHQDGYGLSYFYATMLDGLSDCAWDSDFTEGQLLANKWYNGGMTTSDDPTDGSLYYSCWNGIRQCNVFLQNLDKCAIDANDKPRYRAEAIVLRDFYYFELCRKYGPQPLTREPFDLTTDFSKLKRPTFQQVADFISEDVDQVLTITDLPWKLKYDGERGRFTKAIAVALKSQATLYAASPLWNPTNDPALWTKARDAAKSALDQLTANGYKLYYSAALGDASYANYFINQMDIVLDPRDRETILENQNGGSMQNGWFFAFNAFPSRDDKVKAGCCPSQELVDAFDMKTTGLPVIDPTNRYADDSHLQPNYVANSGYDPQNPYVGRDPRFYATVLFNGSKCLKPELTLQIYSGGKDSVSNSSRFRTFTGYYLNKFINDSIPQGQPSGAPWKKIRLAEIYLNYAEAENEVNGPNQAVYNALKAIRDRVNMPNIKAGITSKDEMRAYIQKERFTEMAYEEQRFWDVRRWKMLDKTDKLSTGMKITKNADNTFSYERFVVGHKQSWGTKYLIFPIPINDASIMNWQNPGW
ncbi:MAG: RagB/SusD family nutrient uptake outer membrane protein [Bacteroidota bacterium]|nr:RagB/SusD family nutrient uptake outer membrane protein [Bacteroidota bacterium]MDP4205043.1 RagB/SusD family nutrient uptake outer membrane protein [Bacteroidota bacterium]